MSRSPPTYKGLISHFEANKNKEWSEWLRFDKIFPKPGKQGVVGLLTSIESDRTETPRKGQTYVFKMSQYVNYLIRHEFIVMKSLLSLSPFCPHFCKPVGILSCKVDPKIRKEGNPFEFKTSHQIHKDVLLTEYVSNANKLYSYIKSERIEEKIVFSTIKQVLMALAIAQKQRNFSHYDLHSDNIMMKKCGKDSVFLYNLPGRTDSDQVGTQFVIPTHGSYPVIIDFGFSYVKDMDGDYMWPSMGHTSVGFMSDRFDWVADPKLFLVTVSGELKYNRGTKNSKLFRRIVRNFFSELDIEFDSGWDKNRQPSASDSVTRLLRHDLKLSHLFTEYEYYCIDLIQTLVILPLQEQSYENIKIEFTAFLTEFVKIEVAIGNDFYSLCVLKAIVDAAREYKDDYTDLSTRVQAVEAFKNTIYCVIDKLVNFCRPKNVQFEKLICAVLCLSKSMEGVLFKHMTKRMEVKQKEYDRMPVQSIEEMLGILTYNLPDSYEYNKNTMIYVFDSVSEDNWSVQIKPEHVDELNETAQISQGAMLWKWYGRENE